MRALGAAVTRTPDAEGMPGAIRRANEFTAATTGAFMAGQFENPANPDYHYETTAPEIFEQMEGRIDALVIGAGTAGTFTGVARFMKERLPNVLAYAVETQGSILGGGKPGPHKVEGIGASFIPGNFDRSVCDAVLMVTDADAFAMVKTTGGSRGRAVGFERRSQCCGRAASRGLAGTRQAGGHHDSGFRRTLFVEEDF